MSETSALRRLLLAAGVVVLGLACSRLVDRLFLGGLNAPLDFAEYWTAGHLNAAGANPYGGANVRGVQRALGLDDTAIMMWNPPWALTLVMPVGAMPFRVAYGVWVLLNLALLAASAELLWRGFGGPPRWRWAAHLVALTFGPTVFLIGSGQITGVVLLGLAGFLYFARRERPVCAGACAALTAVKPHLLALFAVWLLLEAARSAFGRKVLLGGLLVGFAACVPPTLANPGVWRQYLDATRGPSSADHHHVADWKPPVAGWWLRQAVPGEPFAAQWVPVAAATLAFAWWWRRHPPPCGRGSQTRGEPRPQGGGELVPWLVGLSLLAAPYGAWAFDLVLLLVPVLATAARVARHPHPHAVSAGLGLLLGVNAVSLAMMTAKPPSTSYVWVTPAVLLACALVNRLAEPRPALAGARS